MKESLRLLVETGIRNHSAKLYLKKRSIMSGQIPYKIRFLCTGNSARSILGEFLIRRVAPGRFESYSAGSSPVGKVNPRAIHTLNEYRIDASGARSKSVDEFIDKEFKFDFVITVCDNAKENCPVWPGQPVVAHRGSPDPAAAAGTDEEIMDAFRRVAMQIYRRLELFASLPIEKMDRLRLQTATAKIGAEEKVPSTV
jgi:arsenate reductase